ncbi:MBL fold metallo-hydrolase [Leucobacter sp. wl10]|uniref:MBL fold metallo-hydrolase n=1 Tax=Leucobacter sp. wl10 TaxID=2304677 RepID=UPI000E5B57F0|nr:MBL fold metallo-hydrolase [Leucobacter sp. wl10]RGE19302.1 MBL fold metallo-hydrolase [Leucobacter sp. wl10]
MRLVMLGTAGGPRPVVKRAAPAQAVLYRGEVHVIDCGNGVARQMAMAGISRRDLTATYITHHHADHMLDLGALPLIAWTDGCENVIDIYGPPGTASMTEDFLSMAWPEIEARTATTGRRAFPEMLRNTDVPEARVIRDENGLRVSTVLVDHPPFEVALGYRFDSDEGSVVFSGDTRFSPSLVELARGADVLVHEAIFPEALAAQAEGSKAETLIEHLTSCHTTAADAGRAAREAGVGTLVLSHLVPGSDVVSDEMWREAAASDFDGRIVVARDLQEIGLR